MHITKELIFIFVTIENSAFFNKISNIVGVGPFFHFGDQKMKILFTKPIYFGYSLTALLAANTFMLSHVPTQTVFPVSKG